MTHSYRNVVNSILQRGFREAREDLSPMKVQKLLFYLNGWHLAVTGQPAIGAPFEVWKYGPVVSPVYHELKGYGAGRVSDYLKQYDPASESFKAFVVSDADTQFQQILDLTWEKYIGIDAVSLSAMTHASDSPWAIAKSLGAHSIDNEIIKNYFIGLARPGTQANTHIGR